jgi:hypothetical protein
MTALPSTMYGSICTLQPLSVVDRVDRECIGFPDPSHPFGPICRYLHGESTRSHQLVTRGRRGRSRRRGRPGGVRGPQKSGGTRHRCCCSRSRSTRYSGCCDRRRVAARRVCADRSGRLGRSDAAPSRGCADLHLPTRRSPAGASAPAGADLTAQAVTDELTGLATRRAFYPHLDPRPRAGPAKRPTAAGPASYGRRTCSAG